MQGLTKELAAITQVRAGGLGDTFSCKYLQERLNIVNGYQDICPAQFLQPSAWNRPELPSRSARLSRAVL